MKHVLAVLALVLAYPARAGIPVPTHTVAGSASTAQQLQGGVWWMTCDKAVYIEGGNSSSVTADSGSHHWPTNIGPLELHVTSGYEYVAVDAVDGGAFSCTFSLLR